MASIAALALVGVVVGVVLLFFQRMRMVGGFAVVFSFVVLAGMGYIGAREDARLAAELGFVDAATYRKAKAKGFVDPIAWDAFRRMEAERSINERQLRENTAAQVTALKEQARARLATALAWPQQQIDFTNAVKEGKRAYETGSTELQQGASKPARAKRLCNVLVPTLAKIEAG